MLYNDKRKLEAKDVLKRNSITLSGRSRFETRRREVADLQRAGIWPIIYLASSELARASRSATSFGPVCDQIA